MCCVATPVGPRVLKHCWALGFGHTAPPSPPQRGETRRSGVSVTSVIADESRSAARQLAGANVPVREISESSLRSKTLSPKPNFQAVLTLFTLAHCAGVAEARLPCHVALRVRPRSPRTGPPSEPLKLTLFFSPRSPLSNVDAGGRSSDNFKRYDESSDFTFYNQPRFVTHIDDPAIGALTKYYAATFPESGNQDVALLDICSSWISHYPKGYTAGRIAGLGMNGDELKKNPILSDYDVLDLNLDPKLPYEVRAVVVCVFCESGRKGCFQQLTPLSFATRPDAQSGQLVRRGHQRRVRGLPQQPARGVQRDASRAQARWPRHHVILQPLLPH